ncbi:GNAT family N-acetyltransferase [Yersinia pekkanenii]|uniref:Histone acetyltransferase HPA2 and acetyltransferase n=1 Tax=Yersinia pekkanenii TaxID=1288385 RepID=A0A0T9NGQ7_9GAMM|nr:Histone acetyltransferase HPA2 and acetyltransferase [Yersinia pekkanenii]CRY64630.1 Histone acetyltransferase HPA2 and acetyltransferase [Yersinia pekkanenii]
MLFFLCLKIAPEIKRVFVTPNYRASGIAGRLAATLIGRSNQLNLKAIYLDNGNLSI